VLLPFLPLPRILEPRSFPFPLVLSQREFFMRGGVTNPPPPPSFSLFLLLVCASFQYPTDGASFNRKWKTVSELEAIPPPPFSFGTVPPLSSTANDPIFPFSLLRSWDDEISPPFSLEPLFLGVPWKKFFPRVEVRKKSLFGFFLGCIAPASPGKGTGAPFPLSRRRTLPPFAPDKTFSSHRFPPKFKGPVPPVGNKAFFPPPFFPSFLLRGKALLFPLFRWLVLLFGCSSFPYLRSCAIASFSPYLGLLVSFTPFLFSKDIDSRGSLFPFPPFSRFVEIFARAFLPSFP